MGGPPEIPGVEHRYVDAGGLRVHLAEAGEGEPVLLLHGWPQHHYMWRRVIERLAPRYRLLVPDLPGHGGSAALPSVDGLASFADRIADVTEQEGMLPAPFVVAAGNQVPAVPRKLIVHLA